MARIYLSPPDVGQRERELLLDAFDSNWIAPIGPWVDAFEAQFAAFLGVRGAAALSSGTAALHLALLLLDVGPGDEVVVPSLTFVASANTVTYVGATPVFIDSSPTTWTLDPELLADELADRRRQGRPMPRAVIAVDLYGQCADFEPIAELCHRYGIDLIEDAAEALGATYHDGKAGQYGRVGVFSFNGNKIITTSGGGMLVAHDEALVRRARYLASQAREPLPHYEHTDIGFNYRMSNLLAAIGCAQLESIEAKVERRRQINATYRAGLCDLPGLEFQPEAPYGASNHWLTVVTIEPDAAGTSAESVRRHLERLDIESRPAWKPMHLQPLYKASPMRGGAVAERIFATGLCLPSGSSLTEAEQDRVITGVRRAWGAGPA